MRMFRLKTYRPLNKKLVFIFIASTLLPLMIATYATAKMYIDKNSESTGSLIDNTLVSLSQTISGYLTELDQLTLIPYYNDDFIYALKVKAAEPAVNPDKFQVRSIAGLLESQLQFVKNIRKDILSTLIVSRDRALFYSTHNPMNDIVPDYPFERTGWYGQAVQADGRAVLIPPHKQDYFTKTKDLAVFSVVRAILDIPSRRFVSVIKADANTVVLGQMFQGIDFQVTSNIVLLDQNHNLIYAKREAPRELQQAAAKADNHTVIRDASKESYLVVKKSIPVYGWQLIVLLSYSELEKQSLWIYVSSILLYIVCLSVALFFYQSMSRRIMGPVKEIITTMKKVENGDFTARYRLQTKDEFQIIGQSMNSMISELKQKIDREYVLVLQRRNSEYKALQSQIQPHFLFNTLNGFIALNQIGATERLEASIIDLTVMLRYILHQRDMTPLADEMRFIENYCSLQSLRFGSRLQASIDCEPEISGFEVPKLLLQPLVENAILHGIEPLHHPCRLSVEAKRYQDGRAHYIRIRIDDTGAGFDPSVLDGGSKVGLANTAERLKLVFPGSKLTIDSAPQCGTRIVILIPEGSLDHENRNRGR